MAAYYNELDPYAAQWLRNLISAGHIAPGDVDERSIVDVQPDDVRGYRQCHFFAGIGVWSYALRLAGWPDDRPVWTGSCPCQPFSVAGKGGADEDARHLWPEWIRIIRECVPADVFGEQVSAAIGIGWLDDVFASLEEMHYACGAIDFPASSVGAPHMRHRTYFVAARRVGDASGGGWRVGGDAPLARYGGHPDGASIMGDAECARSQRHIGPVNVELHGGTGANGSITAAGFWRGAEWLACIDGRSRPTEPGTFPLAHGAPSRVGRLRAYGNCICAPQAAEFIRAAMT